MDSKNCLDIVRSMVETNACDVGEDSRKILKGTILVIDDDKRVRDVFEEAFDEYKTIAVRNGAEGLAVLRRPHAVDIVILDVLMPGMNGIEVLKTIKSISPLQKVVILTGCDSRDIVIEALRGQADEFIEKPFDIEEMRLVLERLLRQTQKEDCFIDMPGKIELAKDFIRRNYDRPIRLEDVAREVYLSPKYFSRFFKERTGKTFNEYRIELRMTRARELLSGTNLTVSQIASRVGYQNSEAFIKIFKKMTGVAPSNIRR